MKTKATPTSTSKIVTNAAGALTMFQVVARSPRKVFPAYRQAMALELRITKYAVYHRPDPRERLIASGVLLGLKIALREFRRHTQATQQALWTDIGTHGR